MSSSPQPPCQGNSSSCTLSLRLSSSSQHQANANESVRQGNTTKSEKSRDNFEVMNPDAAQRKPYSYHSNRAPALLKGAALSSRQTKRNSSPLQKGTRRNGLPASHRKPAAKPRAEPRWQPSVLEETSRQCKSLPENYTYLIKNIFLHVYDIYRYSSRGICAVVS